MMGATESRSRRRLRVGACGALAVIAGLAPGGASAATSSAEVTVSAGSLSLATVDFAALSAALTGEDQVVQTTPTGPWEVVDARGTGAAWSVVASATDLVSSGLPDRVIPSGALSVTTGTVTAGSGADPVAGMTGATGAAFTAPTGPGQTDVALVSAPGPHRGSYSFVPRLDISIPATALASYVGAPYTTTLTVTIS
jgi:hypothetical protein